MAQEERNETASSSEGHRSEAKEENTEEGGKVQKLEREREQASWFKRSFWTDYDERFREFVEDKDHKQRESGPVTE